MKCLLFLMFVILVSFPNYLFSQTQVNAGDVSGTWNLAGSPYLINGEITIPNDSTLIIEPGILVEFQGHYKLNVQGRLLAIGTITDTIVFTIDDTTGFSNPDTSLGGWHGIRFNIPPETNDSSKIMYCHLQYGKAKGPWPDHSGGAICVDSLDKLIISNCQITSNYAEDEGGGIAIWKSDPKIIENIISHNYAGVGGGIFCYKSSPLIENNIVEYNSSYYAGGGILCNENSNPTITNTTIEYNTSIERGGGIVSWNNSNLSISDCSISYNIADRRTGLDLNSRITLLNTVVKGNTAVQYTAGAQFSGVDSGTVSNCLFASNVASTGSVNWNSGGVSVWTDSNVDFINCTFADNSAAYGAGLTIGSGGVATITNCIFWGNSSDQVAFETYNNLGGTLTVNYCDVQHGIDSVYVPDTLSTLVWGIGNIDSDPFFVDAGNDDYHLLNNSPCIGAGIDSIEIGGIWHCCPCNDIEGYQRPYPAETMPDMGAYENLLGDPNNIKMLTNLFPKQFYLFQNYPNPFNPTTSIEFSIPKNEFVTLKIYDVLGKEIFTLVSNKLNSGAHSFLWNAADFASGIYYYQVIAGEFNEIKKMIMLK